MCLAQEMVATSSLSTKSLKVQIPFVWFRLFIMFNADVDEDDEGDDDEDPIWPWDPDAERTRGSGSLFNNAFTTLLSADISHHRNINYITWKKNEKREKRGSSSHEYSFGTLIPKE